jgi:hypothetical protein
MVDTNLDRRISTANSAIPQDEFSYSMGSFVVNKNSPFRIKFCGKCPALRVTH